jgi:predicted Zn finger-like uncharacterized protein
MLITTCTHCLARFRVTPGQLNLKQGQVRCGHCNQVFSGFEALERFPDDDTGTRILAARAAAAATPVPDAASAPASHPSIIPESLPDADEDALPVIPPLPVDLEPIPLPDPDPEPSPPVAVAARAPEPARSRGRAMNLLSATYDPSPVRKLSRTWVFGCALLLVVLGVEVLYAFRAHVAQGYPVTRPWLESACARVGCRVPWVNDPQLLKLEDSELLEVPGRPTEIALGARIRNLAPKAQEYPYLELTLTDLTGQAAARRVLRPSDYLARSPASGDVLAAGSEISIQMRLETPTIKPTGYELLLFYP